MIGRFFIYAIVIFCGYILLTAPALPADDWIRNFGIKNKNGEWCCGIADCGLVPGKFIKATARGYEINGTVYYFKEVHHGTGDKTGPFDHAERIHEVVPYSEAQPSPDGAYWRCKRPDGSRRCFFAPPPGS